MKASTVSFILFACIILNSVLAGNVTLGVNEIPLWDLCVNGGDLFSCSGHGMCSGPGGQCVCTGGYTGRDCSIPPGGFPYSTPRAAVTQFCQLETGGCSPGMCVGGGSFDGTNLPTGVDGVAALNPTLYGSRYAYTSSQGAGSPQTLNGMYSFVGQSCGTCWKLTRKSVSIVVTVVDRCAGYCRATPAPNQVCTPGASGSSGKECGECIQSGHASVPQCSCLSTNSTNNHGWCDGNAGAHCDWCAANDHPHFDLDITAQMKICGDAGGDGFCFLDSFQMVACPALKGPWPNGSPDGLVPRPVSASSSSSSSSSSSGGVKQGSANVGTCSVVNDKGTCFTMNTGDYMCNGCNLTMCSYGQIHNIGCPAGTSCFGGQCTFSSTCDPKVSLSSACASTSAPTNAAVTSAPATAAPATAAPATAAPATAAPATAAPTQKAPPTGATTRPTPAPTPATSAPTTAPPAPTTAPATPAPASNNHPCQARRRRMAAAADAEVEVEDDIVDKVIVTVQEELKKSSPVVAELIETEVSMPVENSASLIAVSSLVAIVAFTLYL